MTEKIPPDASATQKQEKEAKEAIYDYDRLAKMQAIFLEQIKKNPDIKLIELDEAMRGMGEEREKKILEKVTLDFKDIRHKILELRRELSFEKVGQDARGDIFKGEELYQNITNGKPNGKILVQFTPFAVFMRCEQSSDFAFLFSATSIAGGPDLSADVYKKSVGGMATHFEYAFPDKDVPLIVENSELYNGKTENEIRMNREFLVVHEEQHVINDFFTDALIFEKMETDEKQTGDAQEFIVSYAEDLKNQCLRNAQDEFVAYLRAGFLPAIIEKMLLLRGSPYDYFGQFKNKLPVFFKSRFGQDAELLQASLEEEFYKGYDSDIKTAAALCEILLAKHSAGEIIPYLNVTPLWKWEEITRKLIEDKL